MRIGITCLLGGLMCLAVSAPAKAQYGSSRLEKWEFTPFVGYETPGSFPLNSTSGTVTINDLRVNGATSFGTFIGYSIWSSMDLEFMWDRNLTSYSEQQTPGALFMKAYNSTVDQYQFGPLFTIFGEEHKLRPFIAGGLGFTHEYNSGGNPTRMDFSYSIGGGVKYALTRHLSFRGDARYMPTYANSGLATYCDPFFGCYTAKVSQYQHRGNFVGGLAFRF